MADITLYDAYNRPVKKQDLTREHAAPSLTGIRRVWDESVTAGMTPYRMAQTLQAAAEGDADAYLTMAEEMEEKDLHYACELGKRKLAVSRLPITVESFSDEKRDLELADAVRALVRRHGFRSLVKDLLDALGKGWSVCEIVWDRTGQKWLPDRYEWRDPRFFQTDRVSRREIRLKDETNLMEGLPLAPYKFIVHLPKLKSGIPIRGGIARLAAWSWMFKNYTIKDWMAFGEVFGMPIRIGKYGTSASDGDIAILKTAVANLGSDAAAVIPESMMIELIEAAKTAGGDVFFQKTADWFDSQVSRGILGQTATTQGTPGKLGNEEAQKEVREDIRDDDAEQLEETINRDLVKPFIDLNYGPQENYPVVQLRAPKAEDIKALTGALKDLVPLGFRVEQSVIRDKLGLPDPDPKAKPEDLLGPPTATKTAVNSAARGTHHSCPHCSSALNQEEDQDAADRFAQRLSNGAGPQMDAMVDKVRDIIMNAADLEEIREKLAELYEKIDPADLGEVMMQAMLLGNLAGRAEVVDGD